MAGAGQKRGRRGIIGGYWGGYNLLSSSPTPRALPGKVENLTPPANGKNAPDGAPPVQTEGQSSSAQRAAALAFFFCRAFTCLPPARPAGSAARHALGVAAAATMTTPAPRSRSRSHRPPPAPGRISTASAAHDDHASSRPPPTMTTHQRQPCPTCTAPTACQPCQTSQQQRSRQRRPPGRTSPPAPPTCCLHRRRLPDDPPRSTPQNGHFAPPPEGSDSPPNGIEL